MLVVTEEGYRNCSMLQSLPFKCFTIANRSMEAYLLALGNLLSAA